MSERARIVIGAVCGLKSEAAALQDALRGAGLEDAAVRVAVSGANAQRAEDFARRLVAEGARALASVGVSGGLDPALQPGDLVVTTRVATEAGEIGGVSRGPPPGPPFSRGGEEGLPGVPPLGKGGLYGFPPLGKGGRGGFALRRPPFAETNAGDSPLILGVDRIVASAEEKARLFRETAAVALDMESHAVARVAAAAGLPFLAVRAIADPAARALPEAALGAVAPDGSTRIISTLMKCLRRPSDFPKLLELGRDSDAALKSLRRDLGGLLGGFLLGLDP